MASLSRDETFEILSNHRRRYALHHLNQNETGVDIGELAEHVAAWENDIDVSAVTSTQRKRAYTSLQQFHLPKMDEKGVVDFDERAGTAELTPVADDFDVYLEVVDGRDVPWSVYYLALASVNVALVLAAFAGVYPLTVVSAGGWAVFAATTFLISALIHAYVSRTEMRLGRDETPPEVN